MRASSRRGLITSLCGVVLVAAACGGGSPFAATSINGSDIVLNGTVLNLVPGLSSAVRSFSHEDGVITVSVLEDPNITTEVGPDGSFQLRGLPEGSFTLVFTDEHGEELGTLTLAEVKPNQELTISVEVTDDGVVLVEEQRDGIGHGDVELQGNIDELLLVDPSTDSLFLIAGFEVVARPGTTAIRQGGRRLIVEDLEAGDQVHVKGVWMPLEDGMDPSEQRVLAHEIKLQEEDDEDSDGDSDGGGEKITICHKKKKTLTISINAWPAHQAHGDTMGACS